MTQEILEEAARLYFELASEAVLEGERIARMKFVELAVHFDLDAGFVQRLFILPQRRV